MSLFARLDRAVSAFRATDAAPLRSMPTPEKMTKIRGPNAYSSKRGKKPFNRLPWHNRRWMPPNVEDALAAADGSGQLRDAMKISDCVRSDPIVSGIAKGLTMIPHRRVAVLYSDEAAAYLEGTTEKPGVRTQIVSPDESTVSAANELFGGQTIGLMVWNPELQRPQYEALDPSGLWYRHNSKRWQYHGYSDVFDIPSDRMIMMENDCGKFELQPNPWVLGTLSTNRPWFEGHWHKLAYKVLQSQLSGELRDIWQNAFSMPIIVARTPQGATNDQKARFTESILGAFLRVIGVTPGYDVEMKQATAEGADVFTQSEKNLIEAASIAIWGTLGLIQGGSGFANADLFEQMAAEIISAFAAHLSRRDNDQIWWKVLWWANKRGHVSKAATNACVEYQTESAAVIERKAKAAKALMDVGYSDEEAQHRAAITKASLPSRLGTDDVGANTKQALNGAQIASAVQIVTSVATLQIPRDAGVAQLKILLNVEDIQAEQMMGTAGAGFVAAIDGKQPPPIAPTAPPEAREEEEPEPTYSEGIAAALNERNDIVCPCTNHADRYCPRCGVVRRNEVRDGQWAETWHATRRRVA